MLENREDRVALLRKGISGKDIESEYISGNGLKIVNNNVLFDKKKGTIRGF